MTVVAGIKHSSGCLDVRVKFFQLLDQWWKWGRVGFVSRGYFNRERQLRFCVDDEMDFVAVERIIFIFVSPFCVGVWFVLGISICPNFCGISSGENSFNNSICKCLCYEMMEYFEKSFFAEFFAEVRESGVRRCFQKRIKLAQGTETGIKFKFPR